MNFPSQTAGEIPNQHPNRNTRSTPPDPQNTNQDTSQQKDLNIPEAPSFTSLCLHLRTQHDPPEPPSRRGPSGGGAAPQLARHVGIGRIQNEESGGHPLRLSRPRDAQILKDGGMPWHAMACGICRMHSSQAFSSTTRGFESQEVQHHQPQVLFRANVDLYGPVYANCCNRQM